MERVGTAGPGPESVLAARGVTVGRRSADDGQDSSEDRTGGLNLAKGLLGLQEKLMKAWESGQW